MTEKTEREAFEAWYRREFPACFHFSAPSPFRLAAGEYIDPTISPMWLAWQAARASSPTYAAGWSAAVKAAANVCESEGDLRMEHSIKAQRGDCTWGLPAEASMAQGHKSVTAHGLACAIRALALPAAATDGDVVERVATVVAEQAEDNGIWFVPQTAAEAYLQQELRRLHVAIEDRSPEDCAIAALARGRGEDTP